MQLTPEQRAKVKSAKNAGELLALAKENGIELDALKAERYYADLHREGELADDELDNVSGGCGECEVRSSWAPVCEGQFSPLGDLPFVNCGYCVYFERRDQYGYGVCHRDDQKS